MLFRPLPIITLLSDFGLRDGYAGAMKGAALSACPSAQLVDITHTVPAHDVAAGARILAQAAPCYPVGSVHLAVVDPGVGSARAAVALQTRSGWLVGPDNGLLMPAASAMGGVVNAFELPLPEAASATFHGRDLFAPTAGRLAAGHAPMGLPCGPGTLVRLVERPEPEWTDRGLTGAVSFVDAFGNLITNIPAAALPERYTVAIEGHLAPVVHTYADAPHGAQVVALTNSDGRLEVAANGSSAAQRLKLGPGARVEVRRA